jgi:hypothetical protein
VSDMDAHISDLCCDQLHAGDLPPPEDARARAHASACPPCAARLAAIVAEANAFTRDRPRLVRRSPIRRMRLASLAAIAAAVVLVVRSQGSSDERHKGSGEVQLVLLAGSPGLLVPLSSADRVAPGDSLQAAYSAARDGFGAVLSRDGAGTTTAYVPSRGETMVALRAGTMVSFPESTVLDGVLGEEAVVVIWCEAAHRLAPLLAELGATGAVIAPAGCGVLRMTLDKRASRP